MSDPRDQPLISRDPEAHAKLDRIERALMGDLSTGTPGYMERQRQTEATVLSHGTRLERHSQRIHALEEQGNERLRWTAKTFVERAIGALAAGAVGAVAALFAAKPHP